MIVMCIFEATEKRLQKALKIYYNYKLFLQKNKQ